MTIINMANAMYSNQHQLQHDTDDRLDAAEALLGVSPHSVVDVNSSISLFGARDAAAADTAASDVSSGDDPATVAPAREDDDSTSSTTTKNRNRSDSAGLEALAFLATKEQATLESAANLSTAAYWESSSSGLENLKPLVASAVSSSCSSSDEETMPPPPPRIAITRRRSVSNPEGMEKYAPWDQGRLRFVLPASILEEELAEASAAMKAKQERELEEEEEEEEENEAPEVDEEDEENLDQNELLQRARSRLLEDLSEVNMNGEKGITTLPHTLAKYKEVYNKNGRIGIYTPAERAAIISRFLDKRTRRVWNKKIRYNCRKSLADRRMRVKGRFVKRSTEQQAKLAAGNGVPSVPSTIPEDEKFVSPEVEEVEEGDKDAEMPDVSDPDAGFCPTDDQPFRRLRRHTIT